MSEVLRSIVVDDEALARRGLALRLEKVPQVELVAECGNVPEALDTIAEVSPDLIFLDIQMPEMSGFDLVCALQSDTMPMIIFVTAYDEYAIEAFRVHAVDYLLKPIDEDRLRQSVARALERFQARAHRQGKQQLLDAMSGMANARPVREMIDEPFPEREWPDRLIIKDGNEFQFIKINDIQWIDAAGDYMCVHTRDATHIMRTTMKQLERSLDPTVFLRVHRSSMVNRDYIAGARTHQNGEYQLTLAGGASLKVSRSYRNRIRELIEN